MGDLKYGTENWCDIIETDTYPISSTHTYYAIFVICISLLLNITVIMNVLIKAMVNYIPTWEPKSNIQLNWKLNKCMCLYIYNFIQ